MLNIEGMASETALALHAYVAQLRRSLKLKTLITTIAIVMAAAAISQAQNKAAVQAENPQSFRAGGPIGFTVKLNEAMPDGAHFDFRISPVSADEEIDLGSGMPVKGSQTKFRVSGTLPQAALLGEWHISVIWLFLPGAGWTRNTIATNDLRFRVQGKTYPIPTKAEVTLSRQ